jgi:protein-tyrosine phosphatase
MESQRNTIIEKLCQQERVTINFICSGNIIRSPYAEILFEDMVLKAENKLPMKVQVESGGVTYRNTVISRESANILLREGISKERIGRFSPRYLPDYPGSFEKSDLILVMERAHIRNIPFEHREKTFLLLEFIYGRDEDVPDPYFDPPFDRAYMMIKDALDTLLDLIEENCIKRK